MQVNPISNNNANFKAKFIMDNKGLLRDAYKYDKSPKLQELIYKFSKIGKDQEVEFVEHTKDYTVYKDDIIEVFNRTTGKTFHASCNPLRPISELLEKLINSPSFFKPDRQWQELTGQKVVSSIKESL